MLVKTIENENIERSKAIILQKEKNKKKFQKSKLINLSENPEDE
jgi:hypothetical protein